MSAQGTYAIEGAGSRGWIVRVVGCATKVRVVARSFVASWRAPLSDLGRKHFDRRSNDQQKRSLVKRLADLGYTVEVKPVAS
jgi:hypothetical protein